MPELQLFALHGIGDVSAGDDLARLLIQALRAANILPQAFDVLAIAQKIVSKAEGRCVDLRTVTPSARALELAQITGKDARMVELILCESTQVLRARRDVLITRHRLGLVMANAGIDRSNVGVDATERALLLPQEPDASAAALRDALVTEFGVDLGVLITDSFGRPWRLGTTNVAIGAAGLPALIDRRGESDRYGRKLEVTQVAFGDAVAAAAGLLMGEGAEGRPAVLIRGLHWTAPPCTARRLLRPLDEDLFR